MRSSAYCLLSLSFLVTVCAEGLPVVLNTWAFTDATSVAWQTLTESADSTYAALDAVEKVCDLLCPSELVWNTMLSDLSCAKLVKLEMT